MGANAANTMNITALATDAERSSRPPRRDNLCLRCLLDTAVDLDAGTVSETDSHASPPHA